MAKIRKRKSTSNDPRSIHPQSTKVTMRSTPSNQFFFLTDTSVVMGLEPRTKLELRVYIFKIVIIYTGMNAKGEWVVWPACV